MGFCLTIFASPIFAQNVSFGLTFKPIVPDKIFNLSDVNIEGSPWEIDISQRFSPTFGMVIKKPISKFIFLEIGILYISRKFSQEISFNNAALSNSKLSMVGYEAPITAIIYIPFSDKWHSNSSLGFSADMLSTDLIIQEGNLIVNYLRTNWVSGSFLANTGMEFKTKKKGSIYMGLTFHQPFRDLIIVKSTYASSNLNFNLSGAYLTIDVKYYFNNNAKKKSEK